MKTVERTTTMIIAEGLDACVPPGKGWKAEHERAKNLADAAPDMLACLEDVIACNAVSYTEMPQRYARITAAIAKAREGSG